MGRLRINDDGDDDVEIDVDICIDGDLEVDGIDRYRRQTTRHTGLCQRVVIFLIGEYHLGLELFEALCLTRRTAGQRARPPGRTESDRVGMGGEGSVEPIVNDDKSPYGYSLVDENPPSLVMPR